MPLVALLAQLQQPVFSFFLGNLSDGVLVLGGIDHQHYIGDLTYAPLSATSFWQLDIDSVSVGGHTVIASSQSTIIDTGTPQVCGPAAAVAQIAALWSATPVGNGTVQYTVACSAASTLPSIVFTIASVRYELSAADVIVEWGLDNRCGLGLVSQDGPPDWAFGDVWMRKFFTVFDAGRKRIGFATSAR